MSVAVTEHSVWLRASWDEVVPGFKFCGFTITEPETRHYQIEVVRFYPRSFQLNPRTATSDEVIREALQLGYRYCPDRAIKEILAGSVTSQRSGYIVAPNGKETRRFLMPLSSTGIIVEVPSLVLVLVEQQSSWSVIMAKPWD